MCFLETMILCKGPWLACYAMQQHMWICRPEKRTYSSAETSSAARNDPMACASACFRSMRYLTNMRATSPSSLAPPALQGHQPLLPPAAVHAFPSQVLHSGCRVPAMKVRSLQHAQPV